MDHFTSKSKSLLQDRNHGVLLAGITLVTEMCAMDEAVCEEFRKVCGATQHRPDLVLGDWIAGQASEIACNHRLQPRA